MSFATTLRLTAIATTIVWGTEATFAEDVTLTLESWRTDDAAIWQDKIIPVFEKENPGVKINFDAIAPTEYSAALEAKLAGGTAGDLITCLPFDASLDRFKRGYLAPITDLPGLSNFSQVAKAGWSTDDQKTTFCVPMAAVIHGFIYNKDAFDKLGIKVPATEDEFFAALEKIKASGQYTPLAIGTGALWVAGALGYMNIGPNYWKGEEGRLALIAGQREVHRSAVCRAVPRTGEVEALSPRWIRGRDRDRQPEHVHPRPGRDLSRGFVGNLRIQCSRRLQDGRVPAAGSQGRRSMLHHRSPGSRHRREHQVQTSRRS